MTSGKKWGLGAAVGLLVGFACALAFTVYPICARVPTQSLLNQADSAMRRGQYEDAITKFNEPLKSRLSRTMKGWVLGERAYCLAATARRDEALRDYSEAIRLTPNEAWMYEARGLLHDHMGQTDQALEDFSNAIRLDPNSGDAFRGRGLIHLARQEPEDAIADLREAIRVMPDRAPLYFDLGQAQMRNNEWTSALASFDSAIRLDPNYSAAYARRAEAHELLQDWQKGFTDRGRARAVDPNQAADESGLDWTWSAPAEESSLLVANATQEARDEERALQGYNRTLEGGLSDGKASWVYTKRSEIYLGRREFNRALSDSEKAIALDPKNPDAYRSRAAVYRYTNAFDAGIADCNTALRLAPDVGPYYAERAGCYEGKRDWSHAVSDYKKAIALNPNGCVDSSNSLAWIRATHPDKSLRNGREAVELAQKSCRLSGWKDAASVDTLGAAYAEVGDFEKAIATQRKAISLLPAESKIRDGVEARLKLYRDRQPYRHKSKTSVSARSSRR